MLYRPSIVHLFSETAPPGSSYAGGGGESGGGGSSDQWDDGSTSLTPEDLPLEDASQSPPGGRPPSAPSKGETGEVPDYGQPTTHRDESKTSLEKSWPPSGWPQKGWASQTPPAGDYPTTWFAQQYACIRQGGIIDAEGFCTLAYSGLSCNENEVADAFEKKCMPVTRLEDLALDYANCRTSGGSFNEDTLECIPAKKSNVGLWIGGAVALVAVGIFAATLKIKK